MLPILENGAKQEKMGKKAFDVVVPGCYFCDMVFTGLPEMPQLGKDIFATNFKMVPGGAYYPVSILNRLGINVGWKCSFGNDFFSRYVLDVIREEGIDSSLFDIQDRSVQFVAASFSFADERGFVSYIEAPYPHLTGKDISEIDTRCYLLPGIDSWTDLAEIDLSRGEKSFLVYMDCQHTAMTLETPGLIDALRKVDVFAPNRTEALHLTGESDIRRALARLAEFIPLVLIKQGAEGVLAQKGEEIIEVPAIRVKVVDTTGAGDSFNAGFLFGHLSGASLETCLQYGVITGGLSTTGPGLGFVPEKAVLQKMAQNFGDYC